MMHCDSLETEWLKKLIDDKKKYLATLTNKKAAQHLQKEIMFLQNEILPIVLKNTSIIHCEMATYALRCYETAIKYKCNGVLVYLPITDEYTDKPLIGIANSRDALPFETKGAMQIYCDNVRIYNMDGCGSTNNVKAMQLPIHELLELKSYGRI